MKQMLKLVVSLAVLMGCASTHAETKPAFGQGIMVGEVTATSAVVQVRVTKGSKLVDGDTYDDGDALRDGDQPGTASPVLFSIVTVGKDAKSAKTFDASANAEQDYIARVLIDGLDPGADYAVAAAMVEQGGEFELLDNTSATFRTLAGKEEAATTRFHVVTGMNYDKFYGSDGGKKYEGEDRHLGYPALVAMKNLAPDFIVYTGDDVYYDKKPRVKTLADMRAKWHRQFAQPRFVELNAAVPGYWMKDDHDHRTNDSDATGDYFPSHELGLKTFREQVPIYAATDDKRPTYRTHRISKDLQIWMLEGRDYRDANKKEDGPDKTLWGKEQLAWLKKTLLESDATYKMIISPTPMVGPDDSYKRDNHTNFNGFRHEGDAFKKWATDQKLWENGTYFLCGDRHWQYHSIDASGAHEFSSGAICDANSRLGRKPGDKKSTDPDALITQPYYQRPASGGFLSVVCKPAKADKPATVRFEFYDEQGEKLYSYTPPKP